MIVYLFAIFNYLFDKKLLSIKNFLLSEEIEFKKENLTYDENPHIKINNLNGSWKKDGDELILKNVNFEIEQNSLVAVIGSVGSGKVF